MEDAWWGPTIPLPNGPWFALSERNAPGSIIVNAAGQRYMNEALPYVEATHHMYGGTHGRSRTGGEPAVLDDPRPAVPRPVPVRRPARWTTVPTQMGESGVVVGADTVAELAAKVGIDRGRVAAHRRTLQRVRPRRVDEDFHRGQSAYDRYYSDPTNKPNPSLGELTHSPYYAVKMVPGDLGTKGGVRTDVHGRALRDDGTVIDGLYAAGNVGAPMMGHTSPGPGRHHRARDGVRLPGRAAPRRAAAANPAPG